MRQEAEGKVVNSSMGEPGGAKGSAGGGGVARPRITIYSDGACRGNPGVGGYAAIVVSGAEERDVFGAEAHTTNNRMELTASIRALETLPESTQVHMVTDSQYLVKGMTEWLGGWMRRGWKTASKKPVLNQDLWEQLVAFKKKHSMTWEWVRGHDGHEYNERCDQLANHAIDRFLES